MIRTKKFKYMFLVHIFDNMMQTKYLVIFLKFLNLVCAITKPRKNVAPNAGQIKETIHDIQRIYFKCS